ncbi:MAG: glycosyltransferase, partial [Usitatibacteraceae bacterium]
EIRVPKDKYFSDQWQRLSSHSGEGDLSGPCVAAAGEFLSDFHRIYASVYSNADLIIHDSPFTLDYDFFQALDSKPRVYNSYNCESKLYSMLHAASSSTVIPELVRNLETRLLRRANLVTYCGHLDLNAFSGLLGEPLRKSLFIPNGMTNAAFPIAKARSELKLGRALFLGSGHLPNRTAALFIAGVLARECPTWIFDILGNCLPPGDYPTNVRRHGFVSSEQKSSLLRSADIAINPMTQGGGSSLKILDFIAHGLPILSTEMGMRGFEFRAGKDCIIADSEKFAELLNSILSKAPPLADIAKSAFDFASANYTWSAIARKFYDLLSGLPLREQADQRTNSYVLALNDYDPFDSVGGGATRLQGIYAAVADWSPVVLVCFSNGAELDVSEIHPGITRVRVPKTKAHSDEEAYFGSRFHISVVDIVAMRHVNRNPMLDSIYGVLRKNARMVVCDHPYMSPLVMGWGDRFIYSSQNCEYGLKRESLHYHPDKELLLREVSNAERHCVEASAAVVVVTAEDGEELTRGANAAAPICVLPNGAGIPVEPTTADIECARKSINAPSAVFVGSAHPPNVSAAQFIVTSLALDCPGIEFHIVGAVCGALSGNQPRNVTLWGSLTSSRKSAVLQRCGVALNPMFAGGGSNVKLADFLANGLHTVSTKFGIRGYAEVVLPHVTIATHETFALTLKSVLADTGLSKVDMRLARRSVFRESLSMYSLGAQFTRLLQTLERPRKRMLFVTYRYTYPFQGGAELYLSRLINSASSSGRFDVDVVAPEVSGITDESRFLGRYRFDEMSCPPPASVGVRFARFPLDEQDVDAVQAKLQQAWRAQSEFEKQLYYSVEATVARSGLAWGWGYPENSSAGIRRWGFAECGLHLVRAGSVRIEGFLPQIGVVLVRDSVGSSVLHSEFDGDFAIDFVGSRGAVAIYISFASPSPTGDPRPLAMSVSRISLDDEELNLDAAPVFADNGGSALEKYLNMETAARLSRQRAEISLTEIRGPHSQGLEHFLTKSGS